MPPCADVNIINMTGMQAFFPRIKPTGQRCSNGVVEWVGLFFLVAVGVLILWRLLYFCNYGFDFTDEGSYLNWISNPCPIRDRQSGYVYRPLWLLAGRDVALLRQANVLVTIGVAFLLSLVLLRNEGNAVARGVKYVAKVWWIGLAFGLSSVAGSFFLAFFTPSYNSLAFQGLLVSAIGFTLADKSFSKTSIAGWVVLGAGGCMAFMGKPTTAIALAVFVLLYVFCAGITRPVLLGIAIGTAVVLLVGFMFVVDGSPVVFIERTREAIADIMVFGGGHSGWLRIDTWKLPNCERLYQILPLVFMWFGTMASASCVFRVYKPLWLFVVGWIGNIVWLSLFAFVVAVSFAFCFDLITWRYVSSFSVMPLAGLSFGALLGSCLLWRCRVSEGFDRRIYCGFVLFTLLPYVFAMGSSNNYWGQMQGSGFFWVCAGVVVLPWLSDGFGRRRVRMLLIAAAQVICINSNMEIIERPYRQPQLLRQNQEIVNLQPHGSPVRLSRGVADYIRDLRSSAIKNGYIPGAPVLDLTGQTPGAIFVLGAKPVGTAWLSGGYPGSVAMAIRILDRVPVDELRNAWVLAEPGGLRHLPDALLERYGLSLEKDYGLVSVISTAKGSQSKGDIQCLYKPGAKSQFKLYTVAEEVFPITLPVTPIEARSLVGDDAVHYGWFTFGWEGEVTVQGVEEQYGVMQLVAGHDWRDRGRGHCLLLRPLAAHDQGMPVVPDAQFVELSCDLRTLTPELSGKLLLRLDVRTSSGWAYVVGGNWVDIREEWATHTVLIALKGEVDGIGPIIEWHPGAKGDVLELRRPSIRWMLMSGND